jgi:hypothetical protein
MENRKIGEKIHEVEALHISVGGGGVRGWPDPEERCTIEHRTLDPFTLHQGVKAKGARGIWTQKIRRPLLKYVTIGKCKHGTGTLICLVLKKQ